MVVRHPHLKSGAGVAKVLGSQDGGFLADEQSSLRDFTVNNLDSRVFLSSGRTYAVGVAADVVRADRQVCDLQALDAVDVQALVDNTTVLGELVALPWRHAASSEAVPGGLNMALHWQ